MWQALVIAIALAILLLLGLAALQRAEFRSVFRRLRRATPPPAADQLPVREPSPPPPGRDSPSGGP